MKKITIIWTLVLTIIVVCLTGVGYYLKKNNVDNILETTFENQVKNYLGMYPGAYPLDGNKVKITSDQLLEANYETGLDKECNGYVIVEAASVGYTYKTYISCPDYITDGYNK